MNGGSKGAAIHFGPDIGAPVAISYRSCAVHVR
jgi:hypothetical protein